jgi:predicted nucleic acid-binding protein
LTISAVKSKEIQGYLRGLLDRGVKAATATKLLNKIFQRVQLHDVPVVVDLLYRDRVFSHLKLSDLPTPKDIFENSSDPIEFASPAVTHRVIQLRLDTLNDEVVSALEDYTRLNITISKLEPHAIVEAANLIRTQHGDSFLLFRKLVASQSILSSQEIDTKFLQSEIGSYGLEARNPAAIITADTIGWQYDLISLRNRIIPTISIKSSSLQWRRVANWMIYPIQQSTAQFNSTLHTHWQISFIDALYLVMAYAANESITSGIGLPNLKLSRELEEAWENFTASARFLDGILRAEDEAGDFIVFRCAPAFLENANVFKVRALGDLHLQRVEGGRVSIPSINELASKTFSKIESYTDLVAPDFHVRFPGSTIDLGGGVFFRTMAFLHMTLKGIHLSTATPDEVIELMGKTRELARLLPKHDLRDLLSSENPALIQLIVLLLLVIEKPSTVDSFKFRNLFQKIVLEMFDGEIINFLDHFNKLAKQATQTIVEFLDENTLSQMPRLFRQSEDVYIIRADILEWNGINQNDATSIERAKQLRLDRKLQKIRGQMDDARLSVDSQRYYDWFEDKYLQRVGSAVRDPVIKLPDFTKFKAASTTNVQAAISHRDPGHMLVSGLAEVFKTFCVDNNFGVSSYLGRRIRHGTIRGALLGALDEFEHTAKGVELLKDVATLKTYEEWRERYNREVDKAERTLYFKTKENPDGIISAEIDSQFKFDILRVEFEALRTQFKDDGHFILFPSVTENYCWLLLSPELEALQKRFLEWRMDWGVIPMKKNTQKERRNELSQYDDLAREVNLCTDQAFGNIISWFKKPSSLIPEATLSEIIDVAIIEAKEEFKDFQPKIDKKNLCDETLTGAVYYHVYDALSIIIKNAAKHGKKSGKLALSASVSDHDNAKLLSTSISSSLQSGADPVTVATELDFRSSLDIEGADTFQGKSGILKLQKMKSEGKVYRWSFETFSETLVMNSSFLLSGVARA